MYFQVMIMSKIPLCFMTMNIETQVKRDDLNSSIFTKVTLRLFTIKISLLQIKIVPAKFASANVNIKCILACVSNLKVI